MIEYLESPYFKGIVGFLIGGMFMYALKRISNNQVVAETLTKAQFGTLCELVKNTSETLYNEVSNIWLETNRAKLRPQFCSLLIMHPGGDLYGAEVRPSLMASSFWLGPDQDHQISFAPDAPIPANTLIVVTGPCEIHDIIIANEYQGFFTTPLGQVGITRNQCNPGNRITIRLKGWPTRPSTLSEAELVRQAAQRAIPPWDKA